jgi:Tfp pilus assembly protein PilF
LFVMDSCYSGLALTRGGAPSGGNYLQEITRRTARQMFTAGGSDQQVADGGPGGHSIFTWTLLRALDGEGDLNGDGVITASELAAFAGPVVSSMSHQTPAFGNLPGSAGGEFLFELTPGAAPMNELSARLDDDAGRMNSELAQLRAQIENKSKRNTALAEQLAQARQALAQSDAGSGATRSATEVQTAIEHNELGMQYYRQRDYRRALDEYVAAAQLDPSYALAANNVGFVYFKLGQNQDAVDWFERTLRIDPLRAVAWLNAADAYVLLGRGDDAKRAYRRYLELNPAAKSAEYANKKLAELEGTAEKNP